MDGERLNDAKRAAPSLARLVGKLVGRVAHQCSERVCSERVCSEMDVINTVRGFKQSTKGHFSGNPLIGDPHVWLSAKTTG